jgi:hypothetical protein
MSRSTLSAIFLGTESEAWQISWMPLLMVSIAGEKGMCLYLKCPSKGSTIAAKLFSPYHKAFKSRSKYAVLRLGMSSNIAGVG